MLKSFGEKNFYSEIKDGSGQPIRIYKHENFKIITISDLANEEGVNKEDIYVKYFDKIFRDTNAQSSIRQRVIDATDDDDTFYSIEYIPSSGRNMSLSS